MAFTNLFRRHSTSQEGQAAMYACSNDNSTAETLLDELELQCQTLFANKRDSTIGTSTHGLLGSTYSSASRRHGSVDYSWLSPQNNLLQSRSQLYHLSDIVKMELNELIRHVSPEDCTLLVNEFRQHVRSKVNITSSPETIIAIFRAMLGDYMDRLVKTPVPSNDPLNIRDSVTLPMKLFGRQNRVLPKYLSDVEQEPVAELMHISLASSTGNVTTRCQSRLNMPPK
jgi:hypothetical protein